MPSYCQTPENGHSMSIVQVRLCVSHFFKPTKGVTTITSVLKFSCDRSVYVVLHHYFHMLNSSTCHPVLTKKRNLSLLDCSEFIQISINDDDDNFLSSYKTIKPAAIIHISAGVNGVINGDDFLLCFFFFDDDEN